ncbi:MAG: hypothetical protein ACOVO2_05400 [Emticicia sp.]|uniref:hypothetical protein n=1 Tax=Emticicia sp. TaxID=1930953 RepID=UPI003BA4C50D
MKTIKNTIGFLLCGIALGWMIGMSVTPIIRDVILSLLVVVTTIMGLIAGYKSTNHKTQEGITIETNTEASKQYSLVDYLSKVDLLPIGFCMIGMTLGSALGVYMRTHQSLGMSPTEVAERWDYSYEKSLNGTSNAKDSLKSQIIKQLFEISLGKGNINMIEGEPQVPAQINVGSAVLVGHKVSASFCDEIKYKESEDLESSILSEIRYGKDSCLLKRVESLLKTSNDKENTRQIIKLLLCPDCH